MDSLPFTASASGAAGASGADDANDGVWRALAHPVRRRLLDLLRDGPRSTGELVSALGGERHAVLQHLSVLREADLVTVQPRGRIRLNYLNPVPIRMIYERWVAKYEENWTAALVGLKRSAERTAAAEVDRTDTAVDEGA
jgi:DNA-binding transcriptional ArsR family regulator